ncbi:MAG: hypothetical protein ABNH02_03170 [Pseudomonadales bacterium]
MDINLESIEVTVKSSELTYDDHGGYWWKLEVDLGPGVLVRALCSDNQRGFSMDISFDHDIAESLLGDADSLEMNSVVLNMLAGLLPDRELINSDLNQPVALQ